MAWPNLPAAPNLETEAFVRNWTRRASRESFESFVEAGLLWRKVVGPEIWCTVAVTTTDIQRARDVAAIRGTKRVLISEIFLPADPQYADPWRKSWAGSRPRNGIEEFSALAREYLIGGQPGSWRAAGLGPAGTVARTDPWPDFRRRPGQIVGPVELSGAIAFFQLRAVDSSRDIPADRVKLTYKRLLLPGGRSAETLATYGRDSRACTALRRA